LKNRIPGRQRGLATSPPVALPELNRDNGGEFNNIMSSRDMMMPNRQPSWPHSSVFVSFVCCRLR
jgi:hypothetical protein